MTRGRRSGSLLGFLFRWLVLIGIGVGLAGVLYGIHLDKVVRGKFEGKRWALPARVYARPLELFVGRPLTSDQLQAELQRLSYREKAAADHEGSYTRDGTRFLLRTREFRFWDGLEPSRLLSVDLADGVVSGLRSGDGGADLALLRMDAALIASIYPTHNEDRVLVRRKDLSEMMVSTLMAVEDRNFYSHFGVDPKGILRAAYNNMRAGRVVEGASTITQQLVKNFYLTHERSFKRKLNEAYMAFLLERRYSKDEILETYANEIFLGQDGSRSINGFGLAANFYFNRDLNELDIPQTALLVGLIKGPSAYNPIKRPDRALTRRNLVIDLMQQEGVIDAGRAAQAKDTPLGLREGGGRPTGDYPAFLQLVRRQLQRDYQEDDLRSEGLRIFTTLDPLVQVQAEEAIRTRLPKLEKSKRLEAGSLESAAVVTSVAQGEVLALVGGRRAAYQGFNRALDAVRSIGSLVKPAVYLTALSDPSRYTLVSVIQDRPIHLRTGDGKVWEPKNYDHKVNGSVRLYSALVRSLNLATVNLGLDVGVERVADTLYRMGVQRRFNPVPAILLGSVSLSPLEVAQVYQTIAAEGFRAPLRAIREVVGASGKPLNRYPLSVEEAVDSKAAYLTGWAMRQVVKQGTARSLAKRLPKDMTMAGKTGTTDEMRDSWFAGFSGDKVAVVWVGRDDNKPTKLSGASGALRVWGDIMTSIENQSLSDFAPEGIVLSKPGCAGGLSVPFAAGSEISGCGGGGGGRGRGRGRQQEAQAAVPAEQAAPAPKPRTVKPKPARPRDANLFSDFYD